MWSPNTRARRDRQGRTISNVQGVTLLRSIISGFLIVCPCDSCVQVLVVGAVNRMILEVASRSRLHPPSSASTHYLIAFTWVTSRQVKARMFRIPTAVSIRTRMLNRFQLACHPRGQLSKSLSDGCYSTAGMLSSSVVVVVA